MNNIDIKELENIKDVLEKLGKDEVLDVLEDGSSKYVIVPSEFFDILDAYRDIFENDFKSENSEVKILSSNKGEITYDEYETIKRQLIEAFDKTFKPKSNKLN